MKRALGILLALAAPALLAGCGDEDSAAIGDPAPRQTETAPREPAVVDIVSASAVRGDVSEQATVIRDERDLDRYLRQFRDHPIVGDLTDVIASHELADGRVLGLAVIEISCDEPPSATVTQEGSRFLVTPAEVPDPLPECYAPVTSIAVLDLPG